MPMLFIDGKFDSHLFNLNLFRSYLQAHATLALALTGKGETWVNKQGERFTIIYV